MAVFVCWAIGYVRNPPPLPVSVKEKYPEHPAAGRNRSDLAERGTLPPPVACPSQHRDQKVSPASGVQTLTTTLHIAAAVLLNEHQQVLLVRKRGTSAFMQPGGKIDCGEQPLDALIRELQEELGLVIDPSDATFLGQYQAPAANEPGFMVDCALYRVEMKPGDEAIPAAEIEEAVWVSVAEVYKLDLAPLTRKVILPLVRHYLFTD